jgi:hypothetical protein
MGQERRRKDPISRIKRLLYGLMLLLAVPVGAAAAVGKVRNPTELVTVGGILVLRAGADGGPEVSLESATARVPQGGGEPTQFRVEAQRADGADGTAFDVTIGDLGRFRLLLRSERTVALSAWSLGGTVEAALSAGRAAAPATTVAVPTLRINDMYGNETRYLAFDASIRQDTAAPPELAFRWRI